MRVDAEVTQGRSRVRPLVAAGLSASLLAFFALRADVTPAAWVLVAGAVATVPLIVLYGLYGRPPRSRRGRRRVGADARGLTVDGELVLPRQTILRAHVQDEPLGGHSVIVEARGFAPSRVVHVDSPRIAQALADTLEQPPRDVVELEALPPWAHRMRWLTIVLTTSPWILVNLLRHMPGWTIVVLLGLYGVIALPMLLPQKIAIGDDGILLRWAGRRRFVPFGALREARATALGVELELSDDRAIEIRLTHRDDAEASRRAVMLERIDAGLSRHRALAPAEDEALLTRGDRDLDAWIHEMNALGAADAHGYRTIAIPRERLWALLENPGADPSARQGAALALRARLDEDERERLVAIAQKTASPGLRVSIDAVARAPDPPRLRVALEQADDDERYDAAPPRARRRA